MNNSATDYNISVPATTSLHLMTAYKMQKCVQLY